MTSLVSLRQLDRSSAHIFCMHHAGGAAISFKEWPQHLRPDLAITATVLPGRERRFGEPVHRDLDAAADEMAAAIADAWPNSGGVVLFGHSLGGLLGFEVCRRLEAASFQPQHLVISGVCPVRRQVEERHNWSDDALRELMEEMGGTPAEVFEHKDLLALCLRILRADLRLVDTYRAEGRAAVQVPITAIGGAADRFVGESGLREWGAYTQGELSVEMFPGGHFYLDDHRLDVIRWLESHLQQLGVIGPR